MCQKRFQIGWNNRKHYMAKTVPNSQEYTGKQIRVLEGLEPVRKRPGMYIGSTDTRGLHHCVKEIVDNSVDEGIVGFAHEISLYVREDGYITVTDDGRGIPTDKHPSGVSTLEVAMTKLHAGGKFDEMAYQASGGLHGVGASAVNALSTHMQVVVKRNNTYFYQEYNIGSPKAPVREITEAEVLEKFPLEAPDWIKYSSGTLSNFTPDASIFSTTKYNINTLRDFLRERAYLMAGLYFRLFDGMTGTRQDFYFEGGIKSMVRHMNQNKLPIHPVIHMAGDYTSERFKVVVEVAMQYVDTFTENIEMFANTIKTPDGGTHLTGFRMALNKSLKDYATRTGLLKDEKDTFTSDDLKEGLSAVIFVKMPSDDLQFESQTKAKLNNTEAQSAVYQVVKEALDVYLEEHPNEGKAMLEKVLLAARARLAARAAKDAVIRKGALEGMSLPGKLADCQSRNPEECELFIVEGDSAGGSAKQGRERKFQAIFPLRGKILNTERSRLDKIVAFEELKNLIIAMGTGIGDTFDLKRLRYHRIVLMNDADVDGEHITTLGLTFFFRHMPEIVSNGHLYIAMPPLFKVWNKKAVHYAFSDAERDEKLAALKADNPSLTTNVQRYKGLGEMNPEQLWETTMRPESRVLKQVTIEDAQKADQIFTTLMGSMVPPRKKFIQTHAKLATLDV